jgi:hypothetical protein
MRLLKQAHLGFTSPYGLVPHFIKTSSVRSSVSMFLLNGLYDVSLSTEFPEPQFDLRPKERILFFNNLFMLSTDNSYNQTYNYQMKKQHTKQEFLNFYKSYMSNFAIETILDKESLSKGIFRFSSFFPIVGVFVQIPSDIEVNEAQMPEIYTVFRNVGLSRAKYAVDRKATLFTGKDGKFPSAWIKPNKIKLEKSEFVYLDLSLAVNHLEPISTYEIFLKNLETLVNTDKSIKLITVHNFARSIMSI